MRLVFAMIFMLVSVFFVSAESGYDLVTVPPVNGMVAINETRIFCTYDVSKGTLQRLPHTAVITHYVVWSQPVRPPEYRIALPGTPYWFIVNRETLDANSAC